MVRKWFIFIGLMLMIFPTSIYASVNTCTRSEDDLNVPDKVKYKSSMLSSVLSTPCVDASEKVYDFGDIFTDGEEVEIYNNVISFIEDTSMDLAIVTLADGDNKKNSVGEFADDFYDYNDFDVNGIVYVIDMGAREFYVSVSGEAILYYDDYRIESILFSLDSDMQEGLYESSVLVLIQKLTNYYDMGYSSSSDIYTISNGVLVYKTPWIIFVIIGLIGSLIITCSLIGRNKPVKLASDSSLYLDKNGVKITNTITNFVDSHTVSHYNPPVDHSSGGSSGGSHSGSSGLSHGGGGHKF